MPVKDSSREPKRYGLIGNVVYSVAAFGIRLSGLPLVGRLADLAASGHKLKVMTVPVGAKLDRSPAMVLHLDAAKQLIEASSHIVRTDTCVCRDSHNCPDYPIDLGCLFLGQGARKMSLHGRVRPITKEEAFAHLERAQKLGLVNNVIWSSVELAALGVDPTHSVELCSCCPCCCLAFKTRHASPAFLNGIAGFGVAHIDNPDDCRRCTNCEKACPFHAIRIDTHDGPTIDGRRCKGCGLCVASCHHGVLKIEPFKPARDATPLPGTAYLEDFLEKVR